MILADTSVWVEHFQGREPRLAELLIEEQIVLHPMVLGELACGNLPDRRATLVDLKNLPVPQEATDEEVLRFIEMHRWSGRGIGWIYAHLLASALVSGSRFWTRDLRLHEIAQSLGAAL